MSKILIILNGQFGYNTDYVKMTDFLALHNVKVEILCLDKHLTKIDAMRNVNVKYLKQKKNKYFNYLNFYYQIIKHVLRKNNFNWILVSGGVEYCGIIPILLKNFTSKTQWIMDIRTCAVSSNEKKRSLYDKSLRWSTKFYDYNTIISDLVANHLQVSNYTLLPLGADRIIDVNKKELNPKNINFLYVGTFENRHIDKVIKAYNEFCSKIDNRIQTRFDIVGYSDSNNTQNTVLNAINNAPYRDKIKYHGRKTHNEIIELFEEATVGFSYIPLTDYFNVQPPTKTYEYAMNGIICIGTNTSANSQIINEKNGILIQDDIESIVNGMIQVVQNISMYNSKDISKTVENNTWEKIEERFYYFLESINLKNSQKD
ncbi:glycosyltransferase [Peribacillus simplex]|uniref:glycosyltransferase n=1 Tax=Peribacillus simplex TaxID=1478 RepID=UPI0037F166C8